MGSLRRYGIILNKLFGSEKPVSQKEMIDLLLTEGEKGTLRTLQADIRELKHLPFFEIPIKHKKNQGYILEEGEIVLQNIKFKKQDRESLRNAEIFMSQFDGLSIFDEYKEMVHRFIGFTDLVTMFEGLKPRKIIQFDKTPQVLGTVDMSDILRYIKSKKVIRFSYNSYYSGKTTNETVHPYILKEFNARWYLLAKEEGTITLQSYGLDRMNDVNIVKSVRYDYPPNDIESFYNHSIGVTVFPRQPETIILSFTPFQANYVKSQPLHHSQKIIKETKNEVIITLFTHATPELKIKILGWNWQVKVIEPKSFRDEIISDMKKALKRY